MEEEICKIHSSIENIERRLARLEFLNMGCAMKQLERWLCFDATGRSKCKFIRNFSINCILDSGDDALKVSLDKVLAKHRITGDHLIRMEYLKDGGESSWSIEDWVRYCLDNDTADDDIDIEDVIITHELIDALSHYVPRPATSGAPWIIVGPMTNTTRSNRLS